MVIKAVEMGKITKPLKKSVPDFRIINLLKKSERGQAEKRKLSFSSSVRVTETRLMVIERSSKIKRMSVGFSDRRSLVISEILVFS